MKTGPAVIAVICTLAAPMAYAVSTYQYPSGTTPDRYWRTAAVSEGWVPKIYLVRIVAEDPTKARESILKRLIKSGAEPLRTDVMPNASWPGSTRDLAARISFKVPIANAGESARSVLAFGTVERFEARDFPPPENIEEVKKKLAEVRREQSEFREALATMEAARTMLQSLESNLSAADKTLEDGAKYNVLSVEIGSSARLGNQ